MDIGDLVENAESGARFRLSLAWVVVAGVIGIVVYAEMAGRVAAVCGRPVFAWSASASVLASGWPTWRRRSSSTY